jgi:hypothetical protein
MRAPAARARLLSAALGALRAKGCPVEDDPATGDLATSDLDALHGGRAAHRDGRGVVHDQMRSRRCQTPQTFTAEFIGAARSARHAAGDRWFVDETYVKVAGRWTYLYRAVDQ